MDDNSLWFFIKPGEAMFYEDACILQTTLGSCVSVVLWHPKFKHAGMCHYVMPDITKPVDQTDQKLRYAKYAIEYLYDEVLKSRTKPQDYWVGLYGAIRSQLSQDNDLYGNVAKRNVDIGLRLLKEFGFGLNEQQTQVACDYQKVSIDSLTGVVTVNNGQRGGDS